MNEAEEWTAPSGNKLIRGSGLGLPLFLFVTFRLFASIMLQYGGIFGGPSDFDYYVQMGRLTDRGAWPYLTYWSEYPPIFPWLAVGIYRLAGAIANAPPPGPFVELFLRGVLLLFEIGNFLLVYAIARRLHGPDEATRCAWLYAALFAPAFIWLGWFEPLPLFFALVTVWLLVVERRGTAGLACGLGIVTKLIPGLVALVVLRQLIHAWCPRRSLRRLLAFGVPCVATVLVTCVPFVLSNRDVFAASARSWFFRPPWESVWAVLDGYYSYGFVPSLLSRASWPTYFPSLAPHPGLGLGSLGMLAGVLGIVSLRSWPRYGPAGTVAMTGILYCGAFLVTSGFSPQFMDWVIPFVVLLLPGLRAAIYISVLTAIVLLGERYLYFWLFPPTPTILIGLIALRSALLVGLMFELWLMVGRPRLTRWPHWRRLYALGLTGSMVVLAVVAVRDYAAEGWGSAVLHDLSRESATQLRDDSGPGDAILTFDQQRYESIGPWLGDRAYYYLAPSSLESTTQTESVLRSVGATHQTVVVVDGGRASAAEQAALGWLNRYGTPTSEITLDTGLHLHQFTLGPNLNWPGQPPAVDQYAQFGGQLEFLGYSARGIRVQPDGAQAIQLTLYWRPFTALHDSLELIFQLSDPSGTIVLTQSGRITQRYPPGQWKRGQVVLDDEEVATPPGVTNGSFIVAVGWLDRRTGRLAEIDQNALSRSGYLLLRAASTSRE